ncbi:putative phospholipid ABC transporter permease protein MlaE [bacterium BMS3Bbin10]|nr:putative phospholipid ABC transporter permease protein MlaE [bacterium BMS3Bbin10]
MLKRDQGVILPTSVAAPGYKVELRGTAFCLVATGSWTVREAMALDSGLRRLRVPIPPTPDFTGQVDISGIEQLDTAGAWLLQRTVRTWENKGLHTNFAGATESFEILLDEVRLRSDEQRSEIAKLSLLASLTQGFANAITPISRDALLIIGFLGHLMSTLMRMVAQPWRFRPTSFIHHLDHAGLRAVPIISLICLLIGAVVMQQGIVQLKSYGAEAFAVNMVAILSLREVGILLTAIMVAGRSGSAFTAEIGSMKMREEIDAMRTLGIDPMETLVAPRILALVVVLPLLAFLGAMMCLVGAGVMARIMLGMDTAAYLDALHNAVDIRHFMAGLVKAPFAALIIGLVGCLEGMKVSGSAESLGSHVTSAVVKAIFLVIILDALFAMFLSVIGV